MAYCVSLKKVYYIDSFIEEIKVVIATQIKCRIVDLTKITITNPNDS